MNGDHVLGASDTDRARKVTSGWIGFDRLDDGLSTTAWHVHVEQHDIRQPFGDQLDGGRNLVRLTDDLDRVAELAADPCANR